MFAPFDAEAASKSSSAATGAATTAEKPWKHAVGDPRGSDIVVTSGKYKEARFGVMFKDLPQLRPTGRPAARPGRANG